MTDSESKGERDAMDEWQRDHKQLQSSDGGITPWQQVAQTASATTSADNSSTGPIPYLIAIATILILTIVLYVLFDGIYQLMNSSFDEIVAEYGDARPFSDDNAYGDEGLSWDYYSDTTIDV